MQGTREVRSAVPRPGPTVTSQSACYEGQRGPFLWGASWAVSLCRYLNFRSVACRTRWDRHVCCSKDTLLVLFCQRILETKHTTYLVFHLVMFFLISRSRSFFLKSNYVLFCGILILLSFLTISFMPLFYLFYIYISVFCIYLRVCECVQCPPRPEEMSDLLGV